MKQLPFKPSELTKKILETTNECFNDIGLDSTINEKDPGIYVNGEKVASIGMRIKKTIHTMELALTLKQIQQHLTLSTHAA